MRRKSSFCLVARNRETNNFEIIPINGQRDNALEDIDLYTITFKDASALEKRLQEEGFALEGDTDFFIASYGKSKGEPFLKIQEVLYEPQAKSIKEVAECSKNNCIKDSTHRIDYILDTFAYHMTYKHNFREQVLSGKTNVYEKYAKYFLMNYQKKETIKFKDNGWARESYYLVRNIVEAMSRSKATYYDMSDQMHRQMISEELLRLTDPDYDPNQFCFPDYFKDQTSSMNEEKLVEVMNTFETLPVETFSSDIDIAGFNPAIFTSYDGDDLVRFQTYLPPALRMALQLFLSQRDGLEQVMESRIVLYQNGVQKAQTKLLQLFKNNPELLNRAYDWCQLYDTYQDRMIGGIHGKEYRKKKQD